MPGETIRFLLKSRFKYGILGDYVLYDMLTGPRIQEIQLKKLFHSLTFVRERHWYSTSLLSFSVKI